MSQDTKITWSKEWWVRNVNRSVAGVSLQSPDCGSCFISAPDPLVYTSHFMLSLGFLRGKNANHGALYLAVAELRLKQM